MALLVGCKSCDHEFENDNWVPRYPCPECGSTETAPRGSVKHDRQERAQEQESVDVTWAEDAGPTGLAGWKNSSVIGIIAAVVTLLSWSMLGHWAFKKPKRMRIEVVSICLRCDDKSEHYTDELPAKCEKCGKKTVYRAHQCRGTEDRECSHIFTFEPPKPPEGMGMGFYGGPGSEGDEKLSDEERHKKETEYYTKMMEYEEAVMEAQKCPECESFNTSVIYTEKQQEIFKELRKKYRKKKRKRRRKKDEK